MKRHSYIGHEMKDHTHGIIELLCHNFNVTGGSHRYEVIVITEADEATATPIKIQSEWVSMELTNP